MCSEDVQASVELTQFHVLSVAPFRVSPPPSAVVSLGEATEPISMFLSSTVIVVELISVVVPLTVRSPVIVTTPSAAIVILSVPAVSKRIISSSVPSST